MDFVGKRKIYYTISLVILIAGIGSLLIQGLNLGIDFQSGTLIQLKMLDQDVTQEDIRGALADFGLERSNINIGDDLNFTIKSRELSQEEQNAIFQNLRLNLGEFDLLRVETVGPVIGQELTKSAILALVSAFALMVIYISIRFQFKFALAAIIALIHDSLVMVGCFSLFRWEVESYFIAAVLTIVGYSINNTIVIFDRLREQLKGRRQAGLKEIINSSIGSTMARSINMALVVAFVLTALIFLGGETTRIFAVALFIGNLSGFYSSVFIASPLWYDLSPHERQG